MKPYKTLGIGALMLGTLAGCSNSKGFEPWSREGKLATVGSCSNGYLSIAYQNEGQNSGNTLDDRLRKTDTVGFNFYPPECSRASAMLQLAKAEGANVRWSVEREDVLRIYLFNEKKTENRAYNLLFRGKKR